MCAAGGTTEAVAKGAKAVNARATGVTESARVDPGFTEVPGERRGGIGERLVLHEVQVHLDWNCISLISGS